MIKMKHLSIKISGKVQGVFFRVATRKIAEELGLTGWVRNKSDGSVYVEVEGKTQNLQKLLEWCQKGPENSEIENVEHRWSDNSIGYQYFEIKY